MKKNLDNGLAIYHLSAISL